MDLLEYQAKELFREMDIPVLPSQRIDHPKDLKKLKIPYPVVLKSQVRAGRRGKAGGIKFVENTIDAIAAAQTIFNLSISGEYPEVLLAETKYDADQELYLAVVLDRSVRRPVLLGSAQGGIRVESAIEQVQQVVVDQEFSPFYARRLMIKMGLKGALIQAVSSIVEKMYQLFVQNDLDLVEINPLAINASGEVMALDGKVTVNNDALARHTDLMLLTTKVSSQVEYQLLKHNPYRSLVELDGNIAILCNGIGLAMTTLDLVYQAGGKPANFFNVSRTVGSQWLPASDIAEIPVPVDSKAELREWIEQGIELATQNKAVKVVLINLLSGVTPCGEIAAIIADCLRHRIHDPRSRHNLHCVVRLVGKGLDEAKTYLEAAEIPFFETLDEAVEKAVVLAKSSGKGS